jgi:CheY-like chemotaxis protein
MHSFHAFKDELASALIHLFDPDFQPSSSLCEVLGSTSQVDPLSAIIQAIDLRRPEPDMPASSRALRDYEVLHHRFVLKLTQEQAAEKLHLSVRTVQRIQREATYALARRLWGQYCQGTGEPTDEAAEMEEVVTTALADSDQAASDWPSQLQQELASLRSSDPTSVADVHEALVEVLELEEAITRARGIQVHVEYVQPNLRTALHPTVLRQTLVTAVAQIARSVAPGRLTVFARLKDGDVTITLTGTAPEDNIQNASWYPRDILLPQGASVKTTVEDGQMFLWLTLPSPGQTSVVLVVDDNLDMLHFYRRSSMGKPYRIIHANTGAAALQFIEDTPPDIIVLDVMLPDIDGWKLLVHLHENPATRRIPVVVCSVVREEELAMTLGAAAYLPKPIDPQRFVEILEQLTTPESLEGTPVPTNSASNF